MIADKRSFTNRPVFEKPVVRRAINDDEKDVHIPLFVMLTWIYRVALGTLLPQGLWETTMGKGIGLDLSHDWAGQNTESTKTIMPLLRRQDNGKDPPEGTAYSKSNHALAGVGAILVG